MESVYSILELPVRAGDGDELADRFAELRIFELAGRHGGLRSARLLRPLESGRPFVVVSEWDAAESYRAWLADPERTRVNAELLPLLDGELRGGPYEALDGQGGGAT